MGHDQYPSLFSRLAASAANRRYLLWTRFGLLWVVGLSCLGGAPAIANISPLPDDPSPQPQVTSEDVAEACGPLPIDAYVSHDSAPLRHAFCQLLTFSPFSFSSADSLPTEIVPGSFVIDDEPSSEKMTLPSLWWSRNSLPRQFGSYRLVDSWASYEIQASAIRVIDVYINPQIWRILQYPERYGAMTHLAEEARNAGYNLRLYSNSLRNPRLIGLYVCDFPAYGTATNATDLDIPESCVAQLDEDSIARLQDSLEAAEAVAQPMEEANPAEASVVGAQPPEHQPQTDTIDN